MSWDHEDSSGTVQRPKGKNHGDCLKQWWMGKRSYPKKWKNNTKEQIGHTEI